MTQPSREIYLDELNHLTLDIFDVIDNKCGGLDEDIDYRKIRYFLTVLLGERLISDYRNYN